jgi:hypothetical protein
MPPYTRTLSPLLDIPSCKPFRRGQSVRHLVSSFVADLPAHDSIRLTLEPGDETAFAFSLEGFTVRSVYTFSVQPGTDLSAIWEDCDQKTRNLIRTARKHLTVTVAPDFGIFAQLSVVQRAGGSNTHDFELLGRLFDECVRRSQGTTLVARDENGIAVAAILVVWGARSMYFWQSARIPASHSGGANALLLWTAIEMAMTRGLRFDFDSFGAHGSAVFLASFGLAPEARLEIYRFSVRYGAAKLLRSLSLSKESFTRWLPA